MNQKDLLSLLYQQEGCHISGEEMSQTLGVSRSAVWKGISNLRKQGYHIESSTNKGYCLVSSPLFLEKEKIYPEIVGQVLGNDLRCYTTIDSTNTLIKQQALLGAPEGLCVVSSEQTAGRGRRGRSFHSPSGLGVYLSLLLRPTLPVAQMMELTPWVAVALCEAIFACCGISPQIKWTNDIVWEGKKLCGILTELGLESDSDCLDYVVVGIGTNLSHTPTDFPPDVAPFAISLEQILGKPVDHNQFCVCLLQSLEKMYQGYPQEKEHYLKEYRKACVSTQCQVRVLRGDTSRPAFATHIDEEFRLCVRFLDGEEETQALSTGEVSVRGMCGYV